MRASVHLWPTRQTRPVALSTFRPRKGDKRPSARLGLLAILGLKGQHTAGRTAGGSVAGVPGVRGLMGLSPTDHGQRAPGLIHSTGQNRTPSTPTPVSPPVPVSVRMCFLLSVTGTRDSGQSQGRRCVLLTPEHCSPGLKSQPLCTDEAVASFTPSQRNGIYDRVFQQVTQRK